MKLPTPTPFRLAFALAALAASPCLAQDPSAPSPAATMPDNGQTPDNSQTPAPTPPPADAAPAAPPAASAPPANPAPPPATSAPPAAPAAPPPAPTPPPAAAPAPPAPVAPAPPVDPYANILGPEFKTLGYIIRPPKDFTYQPQTPDSMDRRDFVWQGALHQDGVITTITVTILRATSPPVQGYADKEFIRDYCRGLLREFADVKMSTAQTGRVGEFPALRATWSGTLLTDTRPVPVQGFIYTIQDGMTVVSIHGVDSVPSFTRVFPVLNASALTLHK